jgi:uncharacterized Fe-S cluster-containing protein
MLKRIYKGIVKDGELDNIGEYTAFAQLLRIPWEFCHKIIVKVEGKKASASTSNNVVELEIPNPN